MMALEVTQKCHFQMLTVTVNYPLNQEYQNCQAFFPPVHNFCLENIHADGKQKQLRVNLHHSDRCCTFYLATDFMLVRAYLCCCDSQHTLLT